MSEPKPFASLSPSLLARKGAARPAMRPQLQPMSRFHDSLARQAEEDLGWNDMGFDAGFADFADNAEPAEAEVSSDVVPITPDMPLAEAAVPEVHRQREAIAESVAPIAPVAPEPVAALAVPVVALAEVPLPAPKPRKTARQPAARDSAARRSALSDGRRAAFTLRVDAERHLKLRLACTIRNLSAQQLVTEALDLLLHDIPEVTSLADQVAKQR